MPELKDSATLAWSESGGDLEGTVQGDVSVDSVTVANGGTIGSATTPGAITVKSDGKVGVGAGVTPANVLHVYQNTSETGAAAGITIEQAGAGDAALHFLLSGVQRWVMGADNSAADQFVVSRTNTLGNEDVLTLTTSNNVVVDTGNLVIGTSGNGIDFSATSDASGSTSELLDDYEEGNWTPAYVSTGGGETITYSIQEGRYTKIGNTVYVRGALRTNSISSGSGDAMLSGLPFTVGGNADQRGAINMSFSNDFAGSFPNALLPDTSDTKGTLRVVSTSSGTSSLAWTDLDTGASKNFIIFAGQYEV